MWSYFCDMKWGDKSIKFPTVRAMTLIGMSESQKITYKKTCTHLIIMKFQGSQLLTTMCCEHHICTTSFSKYSTTLQYPKCWIVTTSCIAGLQENSINIQMHRLNYWGTHNIQRDNFNPLCCSLFQGILCF